MEWYVFSYIYKQKPTLYLTASYLWFVCFEIALHVLHGCESLKSTDHPATEKEHDTSFILYAAESWQRSHHADLCQEDDRICHKTYHENVDMRDSDCWIIHSQFYHLKWHIHVKSDVMRERSMMKLTSPWADPSTLRELNCDCPALTFHCRRVFDFNLPFWLIMYRVDSYHTCKHQQIPGL